jgi:hypothetical protein
MNLYVQYPDCAAAFGGFTTKVCLDNVVLFTVSYYYNAILTYKCNGPLCGTNQHFLNGSCICDDGYEPYNATHCVTPSIAPSANSCKFYETLINGTCTRRKLIRLFLN